MVLTFYYLFNMSDYNILSSSKKKKRSIVCLNQNVKGLDNMKTKENKITNQYDSTEYSWQQPF